MMPANEDKENNIVYTGNESSGINFPQTPAHLLKRSHSNILKPPVRLDQLKRDANSNNGNTLKYIQGGKEVSPTKRLHTHAQQQGRLPLAAKDNNRSKSFIFPKLLIRVKMQTYHNYRIHYLYARTTNSGNFRKFLAVVVGPTIMIC